MTQVTLGRWDGKLAVALPDDLVQAIDLRDGECLEIDAQGERIVISRLEAGVTLAALFQGKTQEEWRAEYAGAYEWGPEVGREIVPE
jgi:antitoxin MazE